MFDNSYYLVDRFNYRIVRETIFPGPQTLSISSGHTPSPYYPTQPLISSNHHQGSQTPGVDPRDGRVYLVPSDFQGPHEALRQAWPNTLVLFISLVLFTASISLMFIEVIFLRKKLLNNSIILARNLLIFF